MPPYSDSYWRNNMEPIIRKVVEEHAGESESAIRLALRKANPLFERKYHPYRIWCDQINVQLGKKPHPKERQGIAKAKIAAKVADETVGDLFNGMD